METRAVFFENFEKYDIFNDIEHILNQRTVLPNLIILNTQAR